ncbi:MAG TPA: hypothetical protein VM901_00695 [Bdellovibrionota bacterium]|jgi:hypothetical protein|nr:hypothetical protein [Bdellovibrionota bacterium]
MTNTRFLALTLSFLSFAGLAHAKEKVEVDSKAINEALDVISALNTSKEEDSLLIPASFGKTEVKGEKPIDMLKFYVDKMGQEDPKIIDRMTEKDIPAADELPWTYGFARNVDVVHLAVDLSSNLSGEIVKDLQKKALKELFKITEAGGLVGVDGAAWSVCGVTFPALLVLDPAKKVIYTLTPDDTSC